MEFKDLIDEKEILTLLTLVNTKLEYFEKIKAPINAPGVKHLKELHRKLLKAIVIEPAQDGI